MFRPDTKRDTTFVSHANTFHSVDKMDYAIRRWAIPNHPSQITHLPTQPQTDARLNELQRAIGQCLGVYYEPSHPMPDHMVALLSKIDGGLQSTVPVI